VALPTIRSKGEIRSLFRQPKLSAFPKAYMESLCKSGDMTLRDWVDLAVGLDIDGLEFYSGFIELQDSSRWAEARCVVEDHGMTIPMLCCSPDFTHPAASFRKSHVELEKGWIDMAAALGARYCRVLSGQRRPEDSRQDGLRYAIDSIEECLEYATGANITLTLENHYKDDFWTLPEFAQDMNTFCELVDRIDSPQLGVNYDPSNTYLAGEDPLELLGRVKHRVVTMHASDRYLAVGTLDDLRREEDSMGYARRLRHGEIGKGVNDYDAIFRQLSEVGFDSWISIEDGVDGMDQLKRSVAFLKQKIDVYWPQG
jgi:sugar phosphate isomerase/epimerase